jgi:PPOX class probable F420-dependent enzyme
MSRTEREAFLAGVHVGIVTVDEPGKGPLAVPVWYGYEPGGDVWFSTGRGSRKTKLLEAAGRAGFCIQTETAPYQYVSLEGPVTIGPCDYEAHIVTMARRYLGDRGGDAYLRAQGGPAGAAGSVVVRISPETWRTVDYGKRGRG